MPAFTISLDSSTAAMYENVALRVGLSTEQVLADALFKLAGELSLEAIKNKKRRNN